VVCKKNGLMAQRRGCTATLLLTTTMNTVLASWASQQASYSYTGIEQITLSAFEFDHILHYKNYILLELYPSLQVDTSCIDLLLVEIKRNH